MEFKFTETHLKLKFSWKEILLIILRRGHYPLERKSCYEFSTVLMGVIYNATKEYGDGREHGTIENKDVPENYEK